MQVFPSVQSSPLPTTNGQHNQFGPLGATFRLRWLSLSDQLWHHSLARGPAPCAHTEPPQTDNHLWAPLLHGCACNHTDMLELHTAEHCPSPIFISLCLSVLLQLLGQLQEQETPPSWAPSWRIWPPNLAATTGNNITHRVACRPAAVSNVDEQKAASSRQ